MFQSYDSMFMISNLYLCIKNSLLTTFFYKILSCIAKKLWSGDTFFDIYVTNFCGQERIFCNMACFFVPRPQKVVIGPRKVDPRPRKK